jgi:hypothetical protein
MDMSEHLKGLLRRKGLTQWKVCKRERKRERGKEEKRKRGKEEKRERERERDRERERERERDREKERQREKEKEKEREREIMDGVVYGVEFNREIHPFIIILYRFLLRTSYFWIHMIKYPKNSDREFIQPCLFLPMLRNSI